MAARLGDSGRAGSLAIALAVCACAEAPPPNAPRAAEPAASPVASRPAPQAGTAAAPAKLAVPPPATWPPHDPQAVATDWCTDAVRGLDPSTCFYLPEQPTDTLLIYLHGVVPPERTSVQKTNYQAVVARASRRAGAAALMPRGNQGLTPKGLERWWGWPTAPGSYQRLSSELVLRIQAARKLLEQATGIEFRRVYLAGSSSGAYFVATLAQRGDIDVDGFGAMSGGTAVLEPNLRELSPRPVYIGYGLYDTVGKSARQLGQLLVNAKWPVRVAEHRTGHGAREIYLDEAFPFWAEHAQ
ncbi:MAG: hypothetical protein IPI67_02155 [Myxococcales bacterium]|nr:hypothetical protein [Myxococcales bacterium]